MSDIKSHAKSEALHCIHKRQLCDRHNLDMDDVNELFDDLKYRYIDKLRDLKL